MSLRRINKDKQNILYNSIFQNKHYLLPKDQKKAALVLMFSWNFSPRSVDLVLNQICTPYMRNNALLSKQSKKKTKTLSQWKNCPEQPTTCPFFWASWSSVVPPAWSQTGWQLAGLIACTVLFWCLVSGNKSWLVCAVLEAQESELGCLFKALCEHILCYLPSSARGASPLWEAAPVTDFCSLLGKARCWNLAA